ncbi:hypothetical protein I6F34_01595 [Bradyrhizobium sp. BRP05]|nr:hypothetical protein [Bradyrhizobium sp. BRP05]
MSMPSGGFSLRGVIYGDNTGRYRDGWFIYTSKVMEEVEPNVFKTATGNIYRIDSWSAPSKATSEYETIPGDWPFFPKDE